MIRDREHFPLWLSDSGLRGTGVEVGVYYGQFAEHILRNWPGKLVGVDPYICYPKEEWLDGCALVDLEEAMGQAVDTLNKFGERFRLIRKPSVEAATQFENDSLDFCYLDGNHDYKHVSEDLRAWWPKVKSGGVLGGHDWGTRNDDAQRCDVKGAVLDFMVNENIGATMTLTSDTSFWILKY
jgi:hypothetical protein